MSSVEDLEKRVENLKWGYRWSTDPRYAPKDLIEQNKEHYESVIRQAEEELEMARRS